MTSRRELLGTAVFGAVDSLGLTLGLLLASVGAPTGLIVKAVLGGALAEAVGMAAGAYMADDETGLGESVVMAGTCTVVALAPVVPYLLLPRWMAPPFALLVFMAVAAGIAAARGRITGLPRRALAETAVGLGLIAAACGFIAWI